MKKWTVMVYMAGDNDMDTFGNADIEEMKLVGAGEHFNVVVQFDREGKALETKRYEIMLMKKGKAEARVVESLGETNTGDPKVLEDFIRWGVEKYGAEHYLLVLWNHGRGFKDYDIFERSRVDSGYAKMLREHRYYEGWLKKSFSVMRKALFIHPSLLKGALPGKEELLKGAALERAVCFDEYARDFIDGQELRKILAGAYKKTGKEIDIVGFDACLMNMMEVVCQVRDYVGYVVGSEETEPGTGWPYHLVLEVLKNDPGISPEKFSQRIVSVFKEYYQERHQDWPVIQSAVKMEKLDNLCDAVYEFAGALRRSMERSSWLISEIMYYVQRFDDRDYADLGDFVSLCGTNIPQVRAESERVMKALWDAVVAQVHLGNLVENSNGLSIFVPRSRASLEKNIESYWRLEFNKADGRWVELLDELRPERAKVFDRIGRERVEDERRRPRVM